MLALNMQRMRQPLRELDGLQPVSKLLNSGRVG